MKSPFTTYIAGMRHYNSAYIKPGPVQFEWEPTNKYDKNAIKVIQAGIHVGYIPRDMTRFVLPGSVGTLAHGSPNGWILTIEKPEFILPKFLVNQT